MSPKGNAALPRKVGSDPTNLKADTSFLTEDKVNYISKSIYNICPENSTFEGYFTEKIIQAFEGGTIPFYWAIDLPEKGLINENKYCFCNIDNPIKLKENIKTAIENPNYYLEGNVFTADAPAIISNYYNTLINNIKIKLLFLI